MANKTYPFSTAKHAHDIEFYWNRIHNELDEMCCGDAPMDKEKFNKLNDACDNPVLASLMSKIASCCGRPVWLTGPEIGLAKEIVVWASETRAATCVANGRYDLLKYC